MASRFTFLRSCDRTEYTYRGIVELVDDPYREKQPDENGNDRNVWMFPLRLQAGTLAIAGVDDIEEVQELHERRARSSSTSELLDRARTRSATAPSQRETRSVTFLRDPYVSELAKRLARGHCALCEMPAPFTTQRGEPFLESHHVRWLAHGGPDVIQNTVALCPNCHRKMHVVDAPAEVSKIQGVAERLFAEAVHASQTSAPRP